LTHSDFRSGLIRIEYGEAYEAVVLMVAGRVYEKFESGDVVKDFSDACAKSNEKCEVTMLSSSCDHFVMDLPGYLWVEVEGVSIIEREPRMKNPYVIQKDGERIERHLGGSRTLAEILTDREYEAFERGELVSLNELDGLMSLSSPLSPGQEMTFVRKPMRVLE